MSRFFVLVVVGLLFCCDSWTSLASAAPMGDLPQKAFEILKERCYACHGEGGVNEGGFNYVLNRKRLVRELVVPGEANASRLWKRVDKGEMPPDGRLPDEEIEALREWINAGAASQNVDVNRDAVRPGEMNEQIERDLIEANEPDRRFYRYVTLTHLYNAGFEDNELESHRQGLSKLINSLSWGREIKIPKAIDKIKTIFRIDLRHYRWNENNAWDRIIAVDPYRITYSDESAAKCRALTGCEVPHVRADWFVFAASRPPLYHDVLGIPTDVLELEKAIGVNVAQNLIDFNEVQRAGFYPSGVSRNNRLIERHQSYYGAYWKSYDFRAVDVEKPRRVDLNDTPLGPTQCGNVQIKDRLFEHDGGEVIFNLPNGLQAYMLIDAKGKRIDKGPTDVVLDKEAVKRGGFPEVLNGVSCMSCHRSGMLNKTDQVRKLVLERAADYPPAEVEATKALYPEEAKFAASLRQDRERYEAAVKACDAPLSRSEPVSTLAYLFDEPIDLNLAASEAGVSNEEFVKAINSRDVFGRKLGRLLQGHTIARDTYLFTFRQLVEQLQLGTALPAPVVPKKEPKPLPPEPTQPDDAQSGHIAGLEWDDNGLTMKFSWCPPGEFKMGSPQADQDGVQDEKPQVDVTFSRGFWLGQYEVTQGQWEKVMGTSPWKGRLGVNAGVGDYPASYVTWSEAVRFCEKLSTSERKAGRLGPSEEYRLPTEAEWEYACRAGTTTKYSFGNVAKGLTDYAWFSENAGNVGQEFAHHVGQKMPNAWGLFDMHGNVFEWCSDIYGLKLAGGRHPTGPLQGNDRVYRGGGWPSFVKDCRSASRARHAADSRQNYLGFRVAMGSLGK